MPDQISSKLKHFVNILSRYFIAFSDRAKMTEHSFVLIIAVIIGLIGGYGAVFIQFVIKEFHQILWQGDIGLESILKVPWYWKIMVPTAGGIVVGLVIRYWSAEAKGHGVPEVMEAIALKNGVIRPRVVFAKLFASAFYIASGGSVGREGPVVQIGSAIGSTLGQFFKVNPRRMRVFVACGAASGIAAAFNAPIAGALFAVEIILGDFAVAQFSPIVISSVTATVVSRHFLGDFPAFVVPSYELISPLEFGNYIILGFLAGITAVAFIKVLYYSEDFFDNLKMPQYVKGAIGGLLIGIIGIKFPEIFGVGYDTMDSALASDMIWQVAFVLVFLKIIATSLSLGSGGSGGIFAPSLFIGAMLGTAYGGVAHSLFPEWTAVSGAYALVAMGGVVGAATHGPIAAILIIFELTNDYKIILPLMITTIIATLIAQRLQNESIYTLKLIRKGIRIFGGRELNVLRSLKVKDVIKRSVETIHANTPFSDTVNRMVDSKHNYIYLVDNESKIQSFVSIEEIRDTMRDYESLKNILIAADIANSHVMVIREDDNLDYVMKMFGKTGHDELPVVEVNGSEKIIGSILQTDVISAYNHQIFLRDMTGETGESIKNVSHNKIVQVVENYHLNEVSAPVKFIGKTLGDIGLRKNFNIDVLLIKRMEKIGNTSDIEYIQPTAQTEIMATDILLVFGEEKDLKMLEKL